MRRATRAVLDCFSAFTIIPSSIKQPSSLSTSTPTLTLSTSSTSMQKSTVGIGEIVKQCEIKVVYTKVHNEKIGYSLTSVAQTTIMTLAKLAHF